MMAYRAILPFRPFFRKKPESHPPLDDGVLVDSSFPSFFREKPESHRLPDDRPPPDDGLPADSSYPPFFRKELESYLHAGGRFLLSTKKERKVGILQDAA